MHKKIQRFKLFKVNKNKVNQQCINNFLEIDRDTLNKTNPNNKLYKIPK